MILEKIQIMLHNVKVRPTQHEQQTLVESIIWGKGTNVSVMNKYVSIDMLQECTGCLRTMWTQLWANILLNLWQILPIYLFVFKLWSLPGHLNPIFSNLVQYFWFYEVLKKFRENLLSPQNLTYFCNILYQK